ncbi:MAG: glutamine amidotransferase [Armatimonadota bacterium]
MILTIAGALAAALALYASWLRLRHASAARKALLLGLRSALLLMLLVAVLNPIRERERQTPREPLMLVALDASPSMTELPLDGPSRYDEARAALEDGDAIPDGARVERFLVGAGASRVSEFPSGPQEPGGSDLKAAMSELLRIPRDRPPAACLLVSDGADGVHRPPARVAAGLGAYEIPVYCLGAGSSEPVPDVSIPGLVGPRTVAEGERFELRALVRAAGLADEPVTLSLRESGREIRSTRLEAGEVERPASFDLTAGDPGAHRYVLEARCEAAEASAANNRRSIVVRVEPAEARILWIEGSPRREYAFLRRILLQIDDLDVTILLRKQKPAEFWRDDAEPRRASLRETLGELSRYRAVVLSNIDAGALEGLAPRLADYVTGGGALAMLGGAEAFGAGGWAATPVADSLPVRISAGDGLLADPVTVRAGGDGALGQALRDSGIDDWERLPLLEGMNAVAGVRPGAEIALQTTGTGEPVLAGRRFGAGRTLAVTVDDTWRWRQSPSADAHSRAAWEALWTTVLGRLIAPRADRQVVLELGRDTFEAGEPIRADVHVTDEEMRPVAGAAVRVEVTGAGGEREVEADPTRDDGVYRATVQTSEPGELRLRAVAEDGGEILGEDRRVIEVVEPLGELTDAARPEVLEAIAAETGGRYLPLERAEEMAGILPLEPETEQRTVQLRPARTWWFFALILLVAAADWLLRRRWGLG